MNMRILLSCSAAGLLLAGAVQAGESKPQEREATRQLNIQAAVQAQPAESMAAATIAPAQPSMPAQPAASSVALSSLSSPPDKIATAKVVDDKGSIVGAVQKVELDASGKPTNVEIVLLGTTHIIAMDPSHLRYDVANNVMTAEMDKSQIVAMLVKPQG